MVRYVLKLVVMGHAFPVHQASYFSLFPAHQRMYCLAQVYLHCADTFSLCHGIYMYLHSHVMLVIIGNHTVTFAAIRGTESYSLLSSLTDVMSEVNALIEDPILDGKELRILFGGDYKVIIVEQY